MQIKKTLCLQGRKWWNCNFANHEILLYTMLYISEHLSIYLLFFLCHGFISLNYLPNTWQYFIKMFHVLIHAKYQCKGSINVLHMHHLVSCAFHLCVPPSSGDLLLSFCSEAAQVWASLCVCASFECLVLDAGKSYSASSIIKPFSLCRRWNVSGHFPRLLPDGIERPRKTQSLLSRFWMVYHTTTTSS